MDFNSLVKLIVEPVLIQFQFVIKQSLNGIIEYENNDLTITISYDLNLSYEVDLTLLFKENNSFCSYNELREYFYNEKVKPDAVQIREMNTLIKWLEGVNIFLQENLNLIIRNHIEIQIKLNEIQHRRANNYENEKKNQYLDEKVKKYWIAKDYIGLTKFLKTYYGELPKSIKKKYDFALKATGEK